MMNASPEWPLEFSDRGRRLTPPVITRLMSFALESPQTLSLAAGFTDTNSLPRSLIRAAVDRVLAREGPPECLQYGTNQGRPLLRSLLAKRLAGEEQADATAFEPDRIFITNGSQQALSLAVDVLCDPGDLILVQQPTYFVFLELLKGLGVSPVSIPVLEDGRTDTEGLDRLLHRLSNKGDLQRVKAAYLIGYFSNPSGKCLAEDEKTALAEVMAKHRMFVPVIEDAAYRDLYYENPCKAPSVLALESFRNFPVLYLGTCTKPFATGLKVGFGYCNHPELLKKMLFLKGHQDFGTANFNQAILEEVIGNGGYDDHLGLLRRTYHGKMRVLHDSLEKEGLRDLGWFWEVPEGGLYLWLKGPDALDTGVDSEFCRRGLENGVLYVPGSLCFAGRDIPVGWVRLSFGVLQPQELEEAGRRFVGTAKEFASAGEITVKDR